MQFPVQAAPRQDCSFFLQHIKNQIKIRISAGQDGTSLNRSLQEAEAGGSKSCSLFIPNLISFSFFPKDSPLILKDTLYISSPLTHLQLRSSRERVSSSNSLSLETGLCNPGWLQTLFNFSPPPPVFNVAQGSKPRASSMWDKPLTL